MSCREAIYSTTNFTIDRKKTEPHLAVWHFSNLERWPLCSFTTDLFVYIFILLLRSSEACTLLKGFNLTIKFYLVSKRKICCTIFPQHLSEKMSVLLYFLGVKYACDEAGCSRAFNSKGGLLYHMRSEHEESTYRDRFWLQGQDMIINYHLRQCVSE